MVRKKIDNTNFIENKTNRRNTFTKRKRGFLKKSIEFCNLCGLDMYVMIHDKLENRMIEFRSEKEFGVDAVNKLIMDRKQKKI